MNNAIIISMLSLGLIACGGSGSEESKAPEAAVSLPLESSNEPAGIAALQIDEQFNLSTKYSLNLDVDLGLGEVRAYLNVCQKKISAQRADYNNCVYRGPLVNSMLEKQLTLSREDIELIAEIWFYDSSTQPLLYSWEYNSGEQQQLFIMR
ncbi:hypothetical protein P4S65_14945 [Pseudoalteromonas sp. B131b]|uniref:hypothetical protein n=1 Tax=Pseudoalteromonas sp. B131b TaxID=630493 RepID=UPI00301CACAA